MKLFLKLSVSMALMVWSLISLYAALLQILPAIFFDMPCKVPLQIPELEHARIGYCINIHPPNFSGGSIPKSGASTDNAIDSDSLVFVREGQTLFIDNHPVPHGESYQTTYWTPYKNLWLIYTYRYVVKNEGILSIDSSEPANMLYVSGDAYVGWLPNPAGMILLGMGIWLFIKGQKEQKQTANNVNHTG